MAEKLGFGQEIRLCAGVTADAGTVPDEETLENPAQLANFAFGQGRFTACVPQIAQMMCAAANGGRSTGDVLFPFRFKPAPLGFETRAAGSCCIWIEEQGAFSPFMANPLRWASP